MKKIVAAIFLFAVAAPPLRAQNRSEAGTGSGIAALSQSATGTSDGSQFSRFDNFSSQAGDPNLAGAKTSRTPSRSGLFAPVCLFIMPVVILAVVFQFKHRRNKLMHETLRAMIEKGAPVTPELIASLKSQNETKGQSTCYLLAGLILLGAGTGVIVNSGKTGLIPLLIGVAFLIVWLVEKRNKNERQPPRQ